MTIKESLLVGSFVAGIGMLGVAVALWVGIVRTPWVKVILASAVTVLGLTLVSVPVVMWVLSAWNTTRTEPPSQPVACSDQFAVKEEPPPPTPLGDSYFNQAYELDRDYRNDEAIAMFGMAIDAGTSRPDDAYLERGLLLRLRGLPGDGQAAITDLSSYLRFRRTDESLGKACTALGELQAPCECG